MSNNSGKAVKAGIGYTIGNIFVKGINFLALPLFSRLMTPEEFGVFNVFVSYDAILFVIIGFAIHSSIRSANLEFPGEIDEYTSSVLLMYLLNAFALTILATLFGGTISRFIDFSQSVLYMLIIYSFGSAVLTLYNNRLSLNYSYMKYVLVTLGNSLGNIGLSLTLIFTLFRAERDMGRIIGSTVAIFSLTVIIIVSFVRKARPKYKRKYWRFALKYSLPIVPHGISQVLLAQFDRIMIRSMKGDADAGIYSLAGNIKLILTVISDSITTAWTTWFYEEMEKNNITGIQKRAKQLGYLFALFAVGLISISPELIVLLGGEKYIEGKYVAVPMIIDAFILFVYSIIVPGEYYKKKTQYIMMGTLIAATINVITNYIFIKQYGYIAAAYTTLLSYVCYLALHYYICRKLIGFNILPIGRLAIYLVLIVISAVVTLAFSESILIRYGVCVLIVVPVGICLLHDIKGKNKFWKG